MNHNLISSFAKVFLVIAIISVVSFLVGQHYLKKDASPDPFANLTGSLVYALSPEPNRVTDIYTYNLNTDQESKIFDEDKYVKFSPYVSPDRRYVAYSAAPIDFNSKLLFPHTEHLQIYIYDTQTKSVEKISNSPLSFRNKMPQWSPDGRYILYHGYMSSAWEKNLSVTEPDNWKIYLYDTQTKKTKEMANGVENVWNATGNAFFYIKNDGLHIKNIATGEDRSLVGIVSTRGTLHPKASSSMTLAVSKDGKQLAWATPAAKELVLYSVFENPTPSVVEKYRLKTGEAEIYHPVFSPDGMFLAVQETEYPIERYETKQDPNNQLSLPKLNLAKPRITVYELEQFKAKKIKDLIGFDFFGTSLTQWVK